MLKLVYDLKVGFNDCYVTLIDDEYELSDLLAMRNDLWAEDLGEHLEASNLITDEDFYNIYKDRTSEELLQLMEDYGWGELWEESTRLDYTKLFFSHLVGNPLTCVAGVWEPSRVRLVYDPNTRTSYYYLNALPAKEVCDLLKLTKQQLHYYVKTGQIRKEFNPENPKQFKYNRTDVYTLQKKLEKKYERYI
jgi:hypothetical protein